MTLSSPIPQENEPFLCVYSRLWFVCVLSKVCDAWSRDGCCLHRQLHARGWPVLLEFVQSWLHCWRSRESKGIVVDRLTQWSFCLWTSAVLLERAWCNMTVLMVGWFGWDFQELWKYRREKGNWIVAEVLNCSWSCRDCSVTAIRSWNTFFFLPSFFKSWHSLSSGNEPHGTVLHCCEELSS